MKVLALFLSLSLSISAQETNPIKESWEQSWQDVYTAFPQSKSADSPLRLEMKRIQEEWQATQDSRLNQANAPKLLAYAANSRLEEHKQREASWAVCWEKVYEQFPDAAQDTPLRTAIQQKIEEWNARQETRLSSMDAPLLLVQEVFEDIRQHEFQTEMEKKWAPSLQEVYEKYPDAAVSDTPLRIAMFKVQVAWMDSQDPRLLQADAPMLLVKEAFQEMQRQAAVALQKEIERQAAEESNRRAWAEVVAIQSRNAQAADYSRAERFATMRGLPGPTPIITPRLARRGYVTSPYSGGSSQRIRIFGSNATDENGNTYHIRNTPGAGNMDIEGLLEIRGNTGFAPDGSMLRRRVDSVGNVHFE